MGREHGGGDMGGDIGRASGDMGREDDVGGMGGEDLGVVRVEVEVEDGDLVGETVEVDINEGVDADAEVEGSLGLRHDSLRLNCGFSTPSVAAAAGPASASVRSGPRRGSASCRCATISALLRSFASFSIRSARPLSGSRSSNVLSDTTLRHPFQFTRLRRRPVRQFRPSE